MAEVEPRKPIIIKLYLRRNNSAKRGPSPSDINDDSRGDEKRMKKKIKVDIDDSSSSSSSKPTTRCSKTSSVSAVGKSKTCNCGIVKEYSRTVSEEQQRRPQQQQLIIKEDNTVDDVVEYSRGNKKKTKTESFVKENSRGDSTTTGSEKKKKKMERYKKNQCWVILKRMMIGRDGWALKHPLDDDNYSDHHNMLIRPMGLEEIERKLKKWEYSGAEEFAEDVRLVFSHALLRCPPRSEVHRIAMRLSDSFEISWKSLKEKWSLHELKEQRKLRKKELVLCTPPPHDDDDESSSSSSTLL